MRCILHRWHFFWGAACGIEVGSLDLVSTVERGAVRHITGYTPTKQRAMRGKVIKLRSWVRGDADAGMKWLAMRCPDRLTP